MKVLKLFAAAITVGASFWALGQQFAPARDSSLDYSVTVHYGTNLTVPRAVAQRLESDVLQMLRSANYSSAMRHQGVWQHPEPASEIARRYRELVAGGRYVLATWHQPQKVKSALGELTVVEAIVELERPGVWMCALDPDGRLIHLGKFRGDALADVENLVRQLPR
jgi:hypothetical protein